MNENINQDKIPKIIHYCWFGRGEKSDLIKKCIKSWSVFMPDWEIKEWNEDNYNVQCIEFVREAYQARKWAFVSDYVRFDVLYKYGGVYLDTDVELLKPIPKDILNHEAFTGFEFCGLINPGLIFGSVKNFPIVFEVLEEYRNSHFIVEGKENLKTVNKYITDLLIKKGMFLNNTYQYIAGLAIYESDVFCGYDTDVKEYMITESTVSVHHYASSWKKKTKKEISLNILKKIVGVNLYRQLLHLKRKISKSKTN